ISHTILASQHSALLVTAFVPTVADGEYEGGVVAGVVTANAGIGQVAKGGFGGKRAARFHEHVAAESQTLGEIYCRCVAWRNIAGGEHRAANNGDVRRIFLPTGKIPLPDRGPDA